LVVQHDHASARHGVTAPDTVAVRELLEQRVNHIRDRYRQRLDTGIVDHHLGMFE